MDSQGHITQIRNELDALEAMVSQRTSESRTENWDALELPALIADIVDLLQPLLYPYEACVYWYLFRNCVLYVGSQYVRVSRRGLQECVVKSKSGQSNHLSYSAVQKALSGLEEKGAIQQAGETTRGGTPYKIFLPEEIQACIARRQQTMTPSISEVDEATELDYYNVRENRMKVFDRDSYRCTYCGAKLTRFSATLDHIQPVSRGGGNSFDNLTTACLHCNSR